jgi:hypothetical protein
MGVKAVKKATHRKEKDIDDIRLFVEDNFATKHKYVLILPIAVLELMSDITQAFLCKANK